MSEPEIDKLLDQVYRDTRERLEEGKLEEIREHLNEYKSYPTSCLLAFLTLTGGHLETFKDEREAICKEVEARVPNRAENLLRGFRGQR